MFLLLYYRVGIGPSLLEKSWTLAASGAILLTGSIILGLRRLEGGARSKGSVAVLAWSALVFAALNYSIHSAQRIKDHGEEVLLEIAPVDPRSLIQGDYMSLSYALEQEAADAAGSALKKRGWLVVEADPGGFARFIRLHDGGELAEGEKLLRFHGSGSDRIRVVPGSFLFQEGHAELYQDAGFAVFKFGDGGGYLLVDLADEDGESIVPPVDESP